MQLFQMIVVVLWKFYLLVFKAINYFHLILLKLISFIRHSVEHIFTRNNKPSEYPHIHDIYFFFSKKRVINTEY